MNKFKKLALVFVTAAGIACLAGAAACSKPKYYQLTFEGAGVDYVLQDNLAEFESGGTVKSGLEVKFKVSLGVNSSGTPAISLNGEPLSADEQGYYSFNIKKNSVVSVSGLTVMRTVVLDKMQSFVDSEGNNSAMETMITYTDENGKPFGSEAKVENGGNFRFKLKVSPYYIREKADGSLAYTVSCNTEELMPDANGVYQVTGVDGDSTVSISGLEQEPGFTERGDGTGTAEDPYLIKRPIDLFYVAALTNDDFYSSSFFNAHYKVVEDIDMEGEQLFVIGDSSHQMAVFSGVFDGNNKKIKNFYVTDEVVDQQSYQKEYLPYVGLFGSVVATTNGPAQIKNVVLEDYEVRVHPAEAKSFSYAGSLIGFGIGAQVTGCDLNGTVTAVGDDNQMVYLGGVAGLLQSAYNAQGRTLAFDSFVANTSANVDVNGVGSPRSAGGIVGYLVSADTSAIAYVANCTSSGAVSGAMHSGGIVGTMGRFSSVANCYASGEIIADNGISNPLVLEEYKYAYAGGIAGYASNDTVISNCFAANADNLYAESVSGGKYCKTGDFYGSFAPAEEDAVDGFASIDFNNIKSGNADTIKTQLGWLDADWTFDGEPQVKRTAANRNINLTIKNGSADAETGEKTVNGNFAPIYGWYKDGDIPEFITSTSSRSWGYYFDEQLTRKVPYGYIPTAANVTLYTGFADYTSVAGKYYLSSAEYSGKAYVELTADGKALFREGGLHYEGEYTYDGKNDRIWLKDSCFGALVYTVTELDGAYGTVRGDRSGNGFDFTGTVRIIDAANSTAESISYTMAPISLHGAAKLDDFVYGEYVAANGRTYIFNEDGSGRDVIGNRKTDFTYTVENNEVVISLGVGFMKGAVEDGVVTSVNGGAVTLKDAFAGTWQKTANSTVKFIFDGVGNLTCKNGAQTVEVPYTVTGDTANFTVSGEPWTASFVDGALVFNGEKYYLDDGFTGTWYASIEKERVEVTLEGVGKDDYGYAVISYAGGVVSDVEAQYAVTDGVISIYVGDELYAELTLANDGKEANGLFYSLHYGEYRNAQFDIFDNFLGNWVSSAEDFNTVNFNGKSASAKGEAVITPVSGAMKTGTYTLTDGANGELTVGEKVYTVAFDEMTDSVSFVLKTGGEQAELARSDGWQNVVLYDGETRYVFDGRGYIGGKVAVTGGGTLNYTMDAEGVITLDGTTLQATDGGFNFGAVLLSFKSGFVGEWIMPGAEKTITVGEVNGDLTASVQISEIGGTTVENKTAVYDPAAGILTITERVNGIKAVTTLTMLNANEFSYESNDGTFSEYKVCLKTSLIDDWQGTYTSGNESWTFDGLGASVYGGGTATLTSGGTSVEYRYRLNALGVPYIKYNGGVIFIPTENESGFVKEGQQTKYALVVPDAFYAMTAVQTGGDENTFFFDGAGTLYQKVGDSYVKAYTYEIAADGTLKLTGVNGGVYVGTVTKQGKLNYLKIVAETE